jgi:predicted polyphosphate/ATP-dependent NAD kinase
MRAANVRAIAVLGGDGTHRVVSTRCGEIPLCALSTGTNNAFPELREATVAGLATGLVATGRLAAGRVLRRAKVLRVAVNGAQERDCALVDVATTTRPWVGARAIWRAADVAEAVVAFGEPDGVGLSSLAGLVAPVGRSEPAGVHIRLASSASPTVVVQATLAPGLVTPVGIAAHRRVQLGETVELGRVSGSLALDGERELELSESDRVEVTLSPDGPFVIDIPAAMAEAARAGLLASGR